MKTPALLRCDNWTPPTRTPWGGRRIPERYKAGLCEAGGVVGESWELSLDPAFPSRFEDGRLLGEALANEAETWLGRHARERSTPMLIKLLDAAQSLSVQVHPADEDPWLGPEESGKPEAWVVLAREAGAGIWLGLQDGVTREALAAAMEAGDDLRWALNFVPVEVGDAFVIEAGTVHAVGEGVTLLEPQLVRPGRAGVTYRFWDWGRRYDERGRLDPAGRPRPLHVERSLMATRWDGLRGEAFVESCRRRARAVGVGGSGLELAHVLDLHELRLERWCGRGHGEVEGGDTFMAVVVTAGEVVVGGVSARMGQTLAVPARARWSIEVDGECFAARLT
ncbi:MAG TPA: class I mannose-6-phosphate isomerase [Myxococcota bacterium]|nr:class I mannose-6-phosphate isomerase [Myxococcota bacterium]